MSRYKPSIYTGKVLREIRKRQSNGTYTPGLGRQLALQAAPRDHPQKHKHKTRWGKK